MKPTAKQPYSPVRRLGTVAAALAVSAVGVVRQGSAPTPALPFAQWPGWAKEIAQDRQPSDLGLGDTTVHRIGDEKSEAFQEWFFSQIGKSCGCTERQKWLNQRFPYPDFIALQNQPGNVKTMTQKK